MDFHCYDILYWYYFGGEECAGGIMMVIAIIFLCRLSYVIPSSVVHGIKQVHPMFSGYTQQVRLKGSVS